MMQDCVNLCAAIAHVPFFFIKRKITYSSNVRFRLSFVPPYTISIAHIHICMFAHHFIDALNVHLVFVVLISLSSCDQSTPMKASSCRRIRL